MSSTRIESAIARIDNAMARIDAARGRSGARSDSHLSTAHAKLRGEVDSALVELDALIAQLEG